MIYIFTALYSEAHSFIRRLQLKKVTENTRFQQFTSEARDFLLTVTGSGEIAAAAAVSSVCTKYPPGPQDLLIDIGICAGAEGTGKLFLIHKLTEQTTGKTFYPDLLYRHEFQEAELLTGMRPWKQAQGDTNGQITDAAALYDMEGAAVYQAGAYFFGPHQMFFLKIISDNGEENRLSDSFVRQLMETHTERICAFLNPIAATAGQISDSWDAPQTEAEVSRLCADMHCSKAMTDALRQYIRYAVLTGNDYQAVVRRMYELGRLPCKDKRDGKRCLEELKQHLM